MCITRYLFSNSKCLCYILEVCQIIAAAQAARQRVLHEVDAAHASKHAALSDHERDARAHQGHLAAVATRATEAQRQPNLQVGLCAVSASALYPIQCSSIVLTHAVI
jgi:hypothetical protein